MAISGNKNAALPMIAAAVLSDEAVTLRNVPDIIDVRNMLAIVECLGGKVFRDGDAVTIDPTGISCHEIPADLCKAVRTSLLFAGPMAAKYGSVLLRHQPGGDVIGRRRLDTHFYGLEKLGIRVDMGDTGCRFYRDGALSGCEMFFDEASVTATEHILMTAVLAEGVTVIRNAACEPHIANLAEMLNAMGARISGLETNILTVEGVKRLHGAEITVGGDHIEAASYLALCAATGGRIEITGSIEPHNYWMARRMFERLGIRFALQPDRIYLEQNEPLAVVPDMFNATPVISDGPWPQFPSDMMSCLIATATQAAGTVLFFEKMFESRIYFVDKLISMGANAVVCDPHRVVISGPAKLHGIEMSSPDIRAGMAMVVAAACAEGKSVIHNADMIYRGYESLPLKLGNLGMELRENPSA